METLISSTSSSSSSPLSVFSPKKRNFSPTKPLRFSISCKNNENEADRKSDSNRSINPNILPFMNNFLSLSPLSKDAAMGLVLSAATGKGWTTGSGMEGPSAPAETGTSNISTFPWSLFTKSPRRRMLVAFTCNICGQRTTRAINPHAYNDGTVFVQCCGCNVFHKLVDNLNLFHEMKCYVLPSFNYSELNGEVSFKYLDTDNDEDIFPI
ncbi:Zinc finger, DNL-type, Mitochondrial import protein TIM15 [Thalictrum thalictroides]|uniref:Zinc finger, DNL-type, Mitochondrial import protein TIM15 n=1 Tax=Thalictrum thalictroides TaxID=46969 RepID=A0A7J6WGH6_THATH|nr:Zinc finger, DNL-type, Mitochondrial import protein TIM15 [Thalictrum thalictroides]